MQSLQDIQDDGHLKSQMFHSNLAILGYVELGLSNSNLPEVLNYIKVEYIVKHFLVLISCIVTMEMWPG